MSVEQTHAEVAAALMRQASKFFRSIGEQNQPLKDQMDHNANTFDQVAELLETDPLGKVKTEE